MSEDDRIGYQRDAALAIGEIKKILSGPVDPEVALEEIEEVIADYGL